MLTKIYKHTDKIKRVTTFLNKYSIPNEKDPKEKNEIKILQGTDHKQR